MTSVGLQITDQLCFESWEQAGHRLSGVVDSSTWCLGDWLVYGKRHFPDRYHRAIRAAGLQYQTLRNYAWVARRFPLERRRSRLSFQHHAEVASLPVEEQDWWLDQTEQETWTTKQLRNRIREEQVDPAKREKPQDNVVAAAIARLPIASSHLPSWRRAAAHTGIDFDEWVLLALDRAAEQTFDRTTAIPA
ncbi:LmbU family transcriptional regulator [Nocardia sp. NBC_01499]|uniref:LmbU family transcriptional regulator n=1 Tax=Nocardia sp. NBC_01499 TaxID=2903597 RepID=UPI00386A74EE